MFGELLGDVPSDVSANFCGNSTIKKMAGDRQINFLCGGLNPKFGAEIFRTLGESVAPTEY